MFRKRGSSPWRSAASLVVLGLIATAALSGAATGQSGGAYTIRGGGDLDWVPSGGSFGPSSSSDPISASGTLTGPGGTADYSVAAGPGVVRGSVAGSYTLTTSNRFNPSVQAAAASELTLVGPTGFVAIPVSLNLHVDSTIAIEQCSDSCNISIGVVGHGGITRFSIGSGFTQNELGLTADPVAGGYHLHGDVSTPLGLTPNLPASVNLSLQINVNNLNHGFAGTSVFTVGPSTVSFATSGPVLSGVPPGYTVSGPGVVDNRWTDPFAPVEPTTARLSVNPDSPTCGQQVSFDGSASTAAAGAQLVNYRWDFDDGSGVSVTTEPTTQHTYTSFGRFHPTLIVEDDQGNLSTPDQATVTERDNGSPTAVIDAPSTIANGQTVTFDGSGSSDPEAACGSRISQWRWQIDSGSPVVTNDPTISSTSFAGQLTPGQHTLELTVTDDSGNDSSPASQQLIVTGGLPTAHLSVEPSQASCGQQVSFDGSASTAAAGAQLVKYRWDFDDGSGVSVTTEPTTQHTYTSFGRFHPTLVVQDSQANESAPDQATVIERDLGAPTALISAPATIANGQTVTFDGSGSSDPEAACGSNLVNWRWQIDSGGPITTSEPTISSSLFASQLTPGPHTLSLTVTDDSGNDSSPASQQLIVRGDPPTAHLSVDPSAPTCGQQVSFDGSASTAGAQLVRYRWDFDDGSGVSVTTEPTTQHTYTRFGVYHPTLVVQDSQANESAPDQATVSENDTSGPTAVIDAPASILDGQAVAFDGSGSTDPEAACGSHLTDWSWQVDGNAPVHRSTGIIHSVAFAGQLTPGAHTLTLTVTDSANNQGAPASQQLTVDPQPEFTVSTQRMARDGLLTVQSVGSCPGYDQVSFSLTTSTGGPTNGRFLESPLPVAGDGSWGGTLRLVVAPSPGSYRLRATCNSVGDDLDYVPIPMTIAAPGTFVASRDDMPQSGRVQLLSLSPCPGSDQVSLSLTTPSGGPTGGVFVESPLPVAADGSWGGIVTLVQGPPPGIYRLHATCNSPGGGGDYVPLQMIIHLGAFTASRASMPRTGLLTMQSADPCPGYNQVSLSLTGSAGVPIGGVLPQFPLPVAADGSWGDTFALLRGPPPGVYQLHATCSSPGGNPAPLDYPPIPLTITDATFAATPTSIPVGGQISVQSVDPCPGYEMVSFRFAGSFDLSAFQPSALPLQADGSWGGTITLVHGIGPGSRQLEARCSDLGGFFSAISVPYAPIPLTITEATFAATPTSIPVGGQISVQSIDPCPGGASVRFDLQRVGGGGDGQFEPSLDVNADGSWSGTVTLASVSGGPGSFRLIAHCSGQTYVRIPFTVTGDVIAPTITATAAPGPNANGWNNTDVSVSYSCTDTDSGVDQAASSLGDDVLTASGTATGTCVDNAGNSASASYTAQIDKVSPTVSYAGNASKYSLLDTVAITCSASDALSGLTSTSCPNANGPAWSFGAGAHKLSATATDRAGNTSSASTTFTVVVAPAALSNLTKQFVQSSPRYQALRPAQKAAVDALVTAATNFLLNIGPTTAPALKTQFINAYKAAVRALVGPGWLTADQAATLSALASAI